MMIYYASYPSVMSLTTGAFLTLLLLSGTKGTTTPPHEYRQECIVWSNVSHTLESEPNVEFACHQNHQCTGFDCAGNYTHRGLMTLFHKFVFETCFGVTIHPCHQPVDMQFYVELPRKSKSYQRTVIGSDTVQLEGAKFNLIAGGKADAFIQVEMAHIRINGQPYLKIGMQLKIRMTLHGIQTWPQPFSVQLMPVTEVPVPKCDKTVITPPHQLGVCQLNVTAATIGPGSTVTPKVAGKACVFNRMNACARGEMCLSRNASVHGYCVCISGYSHDRGSDTCMPASTVIPILEPGLLIPPEAKHSMSKELVIVLCCCVAVVAIIAIAVLLVVLRLRKQRSRYAQHELLLNNEDDPLEVIT